MKHQGQTTSEKTSIDKGVVVMVKALQKLIPLTWQDAI
jgi:hypothetical protein